MRKLLITAPLMLALAACATKTAKPVDQTFKSPISVAAKEVASWRVRDVRVVIADEVRVSNNPNISKPPEEIVWWGDPRGDRKEQVSAIMKRATQDGASFLKGRNQVQVELHLQRFHALTPKARSRELAGWHDIQFSMFVRDLQGNVLARSGTIDAGFVGLQGEKAREAVARGQTQKVRINRRVAGVVKAWLNSQGTIRTAPKPAAPARKAAVAAAPAQQPVAEPAKSLNVEDVAPDRSGNRAVITNASVAIANGSSGAAGSGAECLNANVRNPRETNRNGC